MGVVNLSKQTGKSILITRPVARAVAPAMRSAALDGTIVFDTSGVLRVGVSFFDEALLVFKGIMEETGDHQLLLVYRQAPTMQSLKRLVTNRGFEMQETDDGDWIISRSTTF